MMELERGRAPIISADPAFPAHVGDGLITNLLATLDNRPLKVIGTVGIGSRILFGHMPYRIRFFTVHCSTAELPRNACTPELFRRAGVARLRSQKA